MLTGHITINDRNTTIAVAPPDPETCRHTVKFSPSRSPGRIFVNDRFHEADWILSPEQAETLAYQLLEAAHYAK